VHETKRARCLWEAKHARPAMWNCEVFPEVRLHYVHTIAPARAQEFRCQHITKFVAACCTVDFVSRNEHESCTKTREAFCRVQGLTPINGRFHNSRYGTLYVGTGVDEAWF